MIGKYRYEVKFTTHTVEVFDKIMNEAYKIWEGFISDTGIVVHPDDVREANRICNILNDEHARLLIP